MSETAIQVEVAYGRQDVQTLVALNAPARLTVAEAIERAGVLKQFPEIDLRVNRVGIYGKLARLDQSLADGDRVEIYRPLIADPAEQRKKRAAAGKVMRKGVGEEG